MNNPALLRSVASSRAQPLTLRSLLEWRCKREHNFSQVKGTIDSGKHLLYNITKAAVLRGT